MSILSSFLEYFGMQMQINPISKLNIVRSCLIIHREHKRFEKIYIVSGKTVKNEQEMNNIMIFMRFLVIFMVPSEKWSALPQFLKVLLLLCFPISIHPNETIQGCLSDCPRYDPKSGVYSPPLNKKKIK